MAQLPYGRGVHKGPDAFLRQQESLSQRAGTLPNPYGRVLDLHHAMLHNFTPGSAIISSVDEMYFIPLITLERDYTLSHVRARFNAPRANSVLNTTLFIRHGPHHYHRVAGTEMTWSGAASGVQSRRLPREVRLVTGSELAYAAAAETITPNMGVGTTDVDVPFRVSYIPAAVPPVDVELENLVESTRTNVPWVSYMSQQIEEHF